MDHLERLLPTLLGAAWLLPLASFALLVLVGPRLGRGGRGAAYVATAAIASAFVLSAAALAAWLSAHPIGGHDAAPAVTGQWYTVAAFGSLQLSIGYYIDALTIAMFAMVTLVATCIHVYSIGYMHEELHEVTDSQVTLADGRPLVRRGRYARFFQYLSLFCFSMLGLVVAGNLFMIFAFWELVGICSYLLIGFYIERRSASNAANKAFIVNRVGDFGMIIGLMVFWTGLGTLSLGDYQDARGITHPGIFSQLRPGGKHELQVPDGIVRMAAPEQTAAAVTAPGAIAGPSAACGYWLLVLGGLGIFCGCVGKSAQFPLHVWLPDAMEGPTPVSALIHAATMVAAGVYLVGRFYPAFTPEVLLVIALAGVVTLTLAATMALVATDIKRVLAYSTVSQLGYMMLALGVGGWVAGLFHLFTHAFFKALLFLCSGSVIHATGTNEMPRMGGLLKKMPWTAGTMLVGCLAISGAGIPLVVGLSGYYSKDSILAQLFSFKNLTPQFGWMYYVALGGAILTAFYMFRLWFMTFIGRPRDEHVHHHAHESPAVMWVPLVVLAVFAVVAGWSLQGVSLPGLLEQARPAGTAEGAAAGPLLTSVAMPSEHESHAPAIHHTVEKWGFAAGAVGFLVAALFYALRWFSPEAAARLFAPLYWLFKNKWWFDELYHWLFVRPVLALAALAALVDRYVIDWLADHAALAVRRIAMLDDWIDRLFVDGMVNWTAAMTYRVGLRLRTFQTGKLRQYVMLIAVGTVVLFVLMNLWWSRAVAAG